MRSRRIRDQLLKSEQLVNTGTPKAMRLYLPEQVPADEETPS